MGAACRRGIWGRDPPAAARPGAGWDQDRRVLPVDVMRAPPVVVTTRAISARIMALL